MDYIYQLQKSDIKILRYLYHKKTSTLSSLQRKFSKKLSRLKFLIGHDYIVTNYVRPSDPAGFPVGEYPPETIYFLSHAGIVEVENRQWFDWQFVLRNIILPIILAVISTLLTIFLSALL